MAIPPPNTTFSEDYYHFHWPELGIEVALERFQERKDDIATEATVELEHPLYGGRLFSGRLLLIGPNSRRDARHILEGRFDEVDWEGILEVVCTLARDRFRRGEPIVDLSKVEVGERPRFLLEPFIVDTGINIPYGDGKTAKSLFVLRNCVLLALRGIKSLYLDWEDDPETHAERLRAICAGMAIEIGEIVGLISYQRRDTRLADTVRETRRAVAENQYQHVVIDSLGMAAGDPNDHGLVIEAVRAARSLSVATSCIHHLPKDSKDKSKPFGSVYASNEARLTWLFEKKQEEGREDLVLALTNQAFNRGRLQPKQAWRIRFNNDGDNLVAVEFEQVDISTVKEFRGKLPLRTQIAQVLKANGRLNSSDILSVLQADDPEDRTTVNTIGTVLRRYDGHDDRTPLFVKLERGEWALYSPEYVGHTQ